MVVGYTSHVLVVDPRAELVARSRRGYTPLDPEENPLLQAAIGAALNLAYLHDLRPFARWVEQAVDHSRRAGAVVAPPPVRPEARWLPPAAPTAVRFGDLAATAYEAAVRDGVRSDPFRRSAEVFLAAWRAVSVRVELVRPRPRHREPDLFKLGLAYAVALFLEPQRPGPTLFALLLAAIGTDEPIVRRYDTETVADAIALRAERYRTLWRRGARRARDAHARYLVLPGRPQPLQSGEASRLRPPFRLLPTGETVAYRPEGIPPRASVSIVLRRRRPWFYAQWREGRRVRKVPLGPAAVDSVGPFAEQMSRGYKVFLTKLS